jgi:aerobic carbon-monoxide dehydrogenase large subunit
MRTDARRFVTGRVPYSADMVEPGTLHVAVVRSIHAHAFIRSVDVGAAVKAAGVAYVLDGATAKALTQPSTIRIDSRRLPGAVEVRCLADREILYAGEPVCAVVATNIHDAEAAAELVTVYYDVLEPVLDAEVAANAASWSSPGRGFRSPTSASRCPSWSSAAGTEPRADGGGAVARMLDVLTRTRSSHARSRDER